LIPIPTEAKQCNLIFADPPYNIGVDYGEGAEADRLPKSEYVSIVDPENWTTG
jgi:hypothetical protein